MRRPGAALMALLLLALPPIAAGQVKTSVETVGTVVLGDGPERTVRVEASHDEDLLASRESWRRSLTRLRFIDRAGHLLYQETFETRMTAGQGFEGELTVAPTLELRGATRRFVLLTLGYDPSSASGGTTLQTTASTPRGASRASARPSPVPAPGS